MSVEVRFFRHVTQPLLPGDHIVADRPSVEGDVTRGRLDQADDHLDRRGFARTVGPEITRDFTGARAEADVVYGKTAGELLGDVSQFEHRSPPVIIDVCAETRAWRVHRR